jgi:hypothetical protein
MRGYTHPNGRRRCHLIDLFWLEETDCGGWLLLQVHPASKRCYKGRRARW